MNKTVEQEGDGFKTPDWSEKVDRFCGPCGLRKPWGCFLGSIILERALTRGLCGWAVVDRWRGEMTVDGFKPYPNGEFVDRMSWERKNR